jgi:hypothetical protein
MFKNNNIKIGKDAYIKITSVDELPFGLLSNHYDMKFTYKSNVWNKKSYN